MAYITMRLVITLLVSLLPCLIHGFSAGFQGFDKCTIARTASRRKHAPGFSRRYESHINIMMSRAPSSSDVRGTVGKVLLGVSLLSGIVAGPEMARADVIMNPSCEYVILL